ncbi:zinc ABC transporter substrate-binding protein [Vibrio nomapromontoriensis]|uniref:zinc ABC transporter substrate-binding protein n=1 Tax=Vibrio nomapromontoriensis TaxID=2910246 RepID=UPI003D130B9F
MLLALFSLFLSAKSNAVEILSSIRPFQMIALELTLDQDNVSSLLITNASPHDYALKPSDIKRIQSADLVIWFGQDLETFLAKPISQTKSHLALSEIAGIALNKQQGKCGCGHHHGSYDPHVWLGPDQASAIATAISKHLISLNPQFTVQYQEKLTIFLDNLHRATQQIEHKLNHTRNIGYYVFHDAYAYFETYFDLNNLGHFTIHPERKTGAKKLIEIRTALNTHNVKCVFSEPQFTPSIIHKVVQGTNVKIGQLDPLGTHIDIGPGSYFQFLHSIADSLNDCLLSH